MLELLIAVPITLILGIGVGYAVRMQVAKKQGNEAETKARKIIEEAKNQEKDILLEAKDKAFKIAEDAKQEENERREQIRNLENRLEKRENQLEDKLAQVERDQKQLENEKQSVNGMKKHVQELKAKQMETLEKIASLTKDKAKEVMLEMVEKDMQSEIATYITKQKNIAEEKAEKESKMIIAQAIERFSRDQSTEMSSTTVSLPSDDMKGRIIGKEGRNIRRIEELTGVEVVVDDTPGAIVISGFNPIRRHIAKRSLEYLMKDGRIHPARIEETVQKVKQEIAKDIKEAGESTMYDLGIADLDPKIVQLMGRLMFRTSYGQNVLRHSVEVAQIATTLAEELGANVAVAKRAALLHDIGKAVDHEVEGTHLEIGRRILKKFGVSDEIIHGMECHHGDYEPRTLEAHIVTAADAISGSRVGARKDTYENYVKRLEELEGVANSFDGIEKTYAIQAGREIRIFVTPGKVNDDQAKLLARDVANRIEKELKYPGEIKVNVIRETRVVEYAK